MACAKGVTSSWRKGKQISVYKTDMHLATLFYLSISLLHLALAVDVMVAVVAVGVQ